MATKISWTNETWNPVVGCTKVSEGCKNCYAETWAYRLACMGAARKTGFVDTPLWNKYSGVLHWNENQGKWNSEIFYDKEVIDDPIHWRKPRMVFVCSMGDLFHPKVPNDIISIVFDTINHTRQHTYQILTKRPERAKRYFQSSKTWSADDWPNVWLGVSVENQKRADERIPVLLQIPAAVRFVSIEPMLGEIGYYKAGSSRFPSLPPRNLPNYAEHQHIDQVIIGCESINGRLGRECKLEWIESLIDQCKAAGVPVFVKQIPLKGKLVRDIEQFPKELQFQEYPERASNE